MRPVTLPHRLSEPHWIRYRPWTPTPSTTSTSVPGNTPASGQRTWPAASRFCSDWTTFRRPEPAPQACRPPAWQSTRSEPQTARCSSRPALNACPATRNRPASESATPGSTTALSTTPRPEPPVGPRPNNRGSIHARLVKCPTSTSPWAKQPRTSPATAVSPGPNKTNSPTALNNWRPKPSQTGSST